MSSIHKPRVLFTIPNQAWIHKLVVRALIQILGDRRCQVIYQDPVHRPYENNLNHCVVEAIENGYDYWLTMDDDNPPTRNPLDLVSLDLDVIGLPTPVWHSEVKGDRPWYLNALDYVSEDGWKPADLNGQLQEVDAVGSGCMLIARRVLERVPKPLFKREIDEWGRVVRGHDYLFSKKVKEAGFKVWTHPSYICRHYNELEILEVAESFHAMRERSDG